MYYKEQHHGKGPRDGVNGTIKRVVFGLVKSNKITINTLKEFAMEAWKAVQSIQSIYLSQYDEIMELSFVKVAPYIQETPNIHYGKRSFKSNGVCFVEFYALSNDLDLFHVQYYSWAKTLVCDHTGSKL